MLYGQNDIFRIIVPDAALADYLEAEGWRDYYKYFRTASSQDDSSFIIETEDDTQMGDSRIDVIV